MRGAINYGAKPWHLYCKIYGIRSQMKASNKVGQADHTPDNLQFSFLYY